jgi:hypothetical protein
VSGRVGEVAAVRGVGPVSADSGLQVPVGVCRRTGEYRGGPVALARLDQPMAGRSWSVPGRRLAGWADVHGASWGMESANPSGEWLPDGFALGNFLVSL